MYCDKERSSFSANIRSSSKTSLSIVILIFSFNGFKIITSEIIISQNRIRYLQIA